MGKKELHLFCCRQNNARNVLPTHACTHSCAWRGGVPCHTHFHFLGLRLLSALMREQIIRGREDPRPHLSQTCVYKQCRCWHSAWTTAMGGNQPTFNCCRIRRHARSTIGLVQHVMGANNTSTSSHGTLKQSECTRETCQRLRQKDAATRHTARFLGG